MALFINAIWLIWEQVACLERKLSFDLLMPARWIIQDYGGERMCEDRKWKDFVACRKNDRLLFTFYLKEYFAFFFLNIPLPSVAKYAKYEATVNIWLV